MLGLGLESVGYSSVKSELHSEGQADSVAAQEAVPLKRLFGASLALAVALGVGNQQVDFLSLGQASARGVAQNFVRLVVSRAHGQADADAVLIGWQESVVMVGQQEAVATAEILGLPDGMYAEGDALASAQLWAFPNKVQRGRSSTTVAVATAEGVEHATRNAFSDAYGLATAAGEWQLNNTLFASGCADPKAALAARIRLSPAVEPLLMYAEATGFGYTRYRRFSIASASAVAESDNVEHRLGVWSNPVGTADMTGLAVRTFSDVTADATGRSYCAASAERLLFPHGEMVAAATMWSVSVKIEKVAAREVICTATAAGDGYGFKIGDVDALAVADAEGGVKLNDYNPAAPWRTAVVDGSSRVVTSEQSNQVMVI